jgi:thiol:disulfide interchange protein DsbC
MNKSYRSPRHWAVLALSAVLAALPGVASSAEAQAATAETEQRLRNSLAVLLPNVQPDSVEATPIPGLYEVMLGPRLVYMSEDGRYLLQGSIIDLELRENITEPRLMAAKARAIASVGEDRMVIYGPEDPKYVVTVFTDIDCGFCRKLHAEMDKYNANGIQIRYLFYPRAGQDSESYQKAVSVWCADDRKEALTTAKLGGEVPQRTCDNPVREHVALGRVMGLQGTPALVLQDGEMIPGYIPADRLKLLLDQQQAAAQ